MRQQDRRGFTLAEMLVAVAMLALLIVFVGRLFTSASSMTTLAGKHIDCDLQATQVFDRMAVDFAQMIVRPDIDSYVKGLDPETGNDRIAFFSEVPGYYPSTGSQSPTSLVAYRINSNTGSPSFNKMERMGKGLLWNGVSTINKPLIFGGTPTLQSNWPTATDGTSSDPDYETIGSQIFRFEYFYFLNNGTLAATPGANGMADVQAISVCIAIVDPKSKTILSTSQLTALGNNMKDFDPVSFQRPGDMLAQWQSTLDSTADMPRAAISAIRLYQRTFSLPQKF
jgi:prepilin-type N-terminal cleavage/methylation domain-containing protein